MNTYSVWKAVPVLLFLLLGVFLWRGLSLNPHHLPSVKIGKTLPSFHLPRLDNPSLFFDSNQLSGSVVLLNVWASWCAACIEEQVFLMQLAREDIPVYALDYKDEPEDAIQWLAQWGNPYRLIGSDSQGLVGIDLGVYGAPETFVIDKKGIIRYRHAGVMTQEVWQHEIQPLMNQLKEQSA